MRKRQLSFSLLMSASAALLLPKAASAAIFQQTFDNFQGTFESVNLSLNGQSVPTGKILASQNPFLDSVVAFDDSDNTTIFDLNFLLDFPLLSALGLPPIAAPIFETGTFREDGTDLVANVEGMGTIGGDSPFAGTKTIPTVQWRVTSPLESSVFEGFIESETVLICPPGGECVQTTGDGRATRAIAVPESSTILGLAAFALWGSLSVSVGQYNRRQYSNLTNNPANARDGLVSAPASAS
ncbi:MAG: hypothetical protein AAFS04_13990 [Cyanobacteria bacterium J06631_9]